MDKKKALGLILIALALVLLVFMLVLYVSGGLSTGAPNTDNNDPSNETTSDSAESRPTTTKPVIPDLTDENSLNLNNMQVVLPAEPTEVETNAAQELIDYIEKMTGEVISVVREGVAVEAGIYVGDTEFAKTNNVTHPSSEYGEGWAIKAVDGNLVLCGDSVRGTLYAVYHLLEDVLGVHWWTYESEYVPSVEAALVWDEYDDSGAPVFKYRAMHPGAASQSEDKLYLIRNRLNGHDAKSDISNSYGGTENYGLPVFVHTFAYYVPNDMFAEHPEWFSMVDGKRVNNSQLCMTNSELLEYMTDKLLNYIATDITNCEASGTALPRWYAVVPSDWDLFCECENCAPVIERSGLSGYLLKFINEMAAVVAEEYPDVLIDTLAYWQYKEPPLDDTKPADNVVIRFADNGMDVLHGIDHDNNTNTYNYMLGWKDLVQEGQYFYWDYLTTYGDAGPATFMYKLPSHFQTLCDLGVTGFFGEFENPINTDFWDMKMWLCAKLLEDPYQDFEALVDTFVNGYYGAAAPYVKEYLDLGEARLAEFPVYANFGTATNKPKWLKVEDIIAADESFNKAFEAAAGDAELLVRLRYARNCLDRAILERYDYYTREAEKQGLAFNIDELDVCMRLNDCIAEQIELRGYSDYTITGGVNDYGWVEKYQALLEKLLNN